MSLFNLEYYEKFLKKFLCTITTVIYKASDFELVGKYIYIDKHMCNHYTWWFKCQSILHLV